MDPPTTWLSPLGLLLCGALGAQAPDQSPARPRPGGAATAAAEHGYAVGDLYAGRDRRSGDRHERPFAAQIDLALTWLADAQRDDGTLPAPSRERLFGTTSLALLAWLGDGSTLHGGPHQHQLRRGVDWVRDLQARDGWFGMRGSAVSVRDHALATLAIVEACRLSNERNVRNTAQRGIDWLLAQADAGAFDPETTAWSVLVCRAALELDFAVPTDALPRALAWLDAERAGDARTAAAVLLARCLAGDDAIDDDAPVLVDRIVKTKPRWEPQAIAPDSWLLSTDALFQVGGAAWRDWREALLPQVAERQLQTGEAAGSWDVGPAWEGRRAEVTAMLALVLEAGHRYARLIR